MNNTKTKAERISVDEAAKRLGIHPDDLRQAIRERRTPFSAWATQPSGLKWSYIIPRAAFENWMDGQTPPGADEIATALADLLGPRLPDVFFQFYQNLKG